MTRVNILLVWIALASTSAFKQNHYPSYSERYRRLRSAFEGAYGSVDRSQNERSIPFTSDYQSISRLSEAQPRSGDSSHRYNPVKNHASSSISMRGSLAADSDSIVFPGPSSRPNTNVLDPENGISRECRDLGICESVPNYPHEIVDNLLSKVKDAKYRFNLDEDTPEIAQRTGPADEDIELCDHYEKIFYPKAGKNIQNKWRYIINNDDKPVQGFKVEICRNANNSCSDLVYYSGGYSGRCHQKLGNRIIWVLDENNQMVTETIRIPTCCACILKAV